MQLTTLSNEFEIMIVQNYNTAHSKATYKYFLKVFYNKINKKNIMHKLGSTTYIITT